MVFVASDTPDEILVQETLQGNTEAFAEISRRYKTRIFGLVSRFARETSDIDDLCQEVFVQAYFKLHQFRQDSPFEHWLLRIATFKCYDYLRKKRRDPARVSIDALVESGYEPHAPHQPEEHPELERLHRALAQLAPKERLVITLLELEDHSLAEISRQTGWSIANVKVRAFRARAALRQWMTLKNTP